MQFIPKNEYFKLPNNTLDVIRKDVGLDKPGEMQDVINIVRKWIQKQAHFKKKDFSDHFLEVTIITSKGSVEKAKKFIDNICTFRTIMLNFFDSCDVRKDFKIFDDKITYPVILPKLTKDYCRVMAAKVIGSYPRAEDYMEFYKYTYMLCNYTREHDYIGSYRILFDLTEANILNIVKMVNLLEMRQAFIILMDGYGLRIKGIHFVTTSKAVELLLGILKQILKPKIMSRVSTHKCYEEVYEFIDKDILPIEFGGTESSLEILNEECLKILSSESSKKFLFEMNMAGTYESLRPTRHIETEYAGMPGSFRVLSID